MLTIATMILAAASCGVWQAPALAPQLTELPPQIGQLPHPLEPFSGPEVDLFETRLPDTLPVYGVLPPITIRPVVTINGRTFDSAAVVLNSFFLIEWSTPGRPVVRDQINIDLKTLKFSGYVDGNLRKGRYQFRVRALPRDDANQFAPSFSSKLVPIQITENYTVDVSPTSAARFGEGRGPHHADAI